jgi:HEAT repeat protein
VLLATTRLAAADALGKRVTSGNELDAAALMKKGLVDRLAAARLLSHASTDPGLALLELLTIDKEPAVAAIAMQRLLDVDAKRLWPAHATYLQSVDPKVRDLAVRSLATRTQPDTLPVVVKVLGDPHPEVRTHARETLGALARQPALRGPTIKLLHEVIKRDAEADRDTQLKRWRDVEQAAWLLGELDDKAAAWPLWALRDYARVEVRAAAVNSVRELAVPETFGAALEYAKSRIAESKRPHEPSAGCGEREGGQCGDRSVPRGHGGVGVGLRGAGGLAGRRGRARASPDHSQGPCGRRQGAVGGHLGHRAHPRRQA